MKTMIVMVGTLMRLTHLDSDCDGGEADNTDV